MRPVRIREHHLEVPRTARYATLGRPTPDVREVWFVLHGYRQLAARFLRRFAGIADESRWLVAPEALSRFYVGPVSGRHGPESVVGATWMTREDRETEIRDYVRYLDLLGAHIVEGAPVGARVTVLGFSQGVHTATRWAAYGRVPARRLVLWGEHLPPDLDWGRAEDRLRGMELILVRGREDAALIPARSDEEVRKLERRGVPHRLLTYEGGHDIEPGALTQLAAWF